MRSLHIAATVLATGTVGFMAMVAEPALRGVAGAPAGAATLRRGWIVMVWLALGVAIVTGGLWLAFLAADIYGVPVIAVCLHGGIWPVLTGTRFGLVWTSRLALAVLLGLLLIAPAGRPAPLLQRAAQLIAAVLLIALLAYVGHAGAAPGTAGEIHLTSDIVHLIAAAAWLGSLPALALLLAHARRAQDSDWRAIAARAARRYSILGMFAVAAILASGIVNSWMLLSGPRDLIATDYGRLVALKIALFAAMVGIATVNRFHLTPRLATSGALRALTRNSLIETGLGLCVVVFVGALGTMQPTAHVHVGPPNIPDDAAFTHIHTEQAMADVTIDPGRAGPANVTIRVLREDLTQYPAQSVQLALDPPTGKPQQVARTAAHMPDGSWQVNAIGLAQGGIWTVRVIITGEHGEPIVLDAPIVIDR